MVFLRVFSLLTLDYNIGKLHRLIKDDLPHCLNGLIETWKQIYEIQERQKIDPDYRYVAELPSSGESG